MLSWRIEYPFTKLILRKDDYSIVGCHMIGPEASTMIHQVLILIQLKNDVREIGKMVHIHPSLSESLLAAAAEAVMEVAATNQQQPTQTQMHVQQQASSKKRHTTKNKATESRKKPKRNDKKPQDKPKSLTESLYAMARSVSWVDEPSSPPQEAPKARSPKDKHLRILAKALGDSSFLRN